MKEIVLYSGKKSKIKHSGFVATVDDEDYENLKCHTWYLQKREESLNSIYYAIRWYIKDGKTKIISMHRSLMNPSDSSEKVDHIDKNGLNNQRHNLRVCTHSQNIANRRKFKNSSSQYLGVHLDDRRKTPTWIAKSVKNGVVKRRCFKTEIEAAIAYNRFAIENHGEFANLNIIP